MSSLLHTIRRASAASDQLRLYALGKSTDDDNVWWVCEFRKMLENEKTSCLLEKWVYIDTLGLNADAYELIVVALARVIELRIKAAQLKAKAAE